MAYICDFSFVNQLTFKNFSKSLLVHPNMKYLYMFLLTVTNKKLAIIWLFATKSPSMPFFSWLQIKGSGGFQKGAICSCSSKGCKATACQRITGNGQSLTGTTLKPFELQGCTAPFWKLSNPIYFEPNG